MRAILMLACAAVFAIGGCPQEAVPKTAADYNGTWHVVATDDAQNFCLLIAGENPATMDLQCGGQYILALGGGTVQVAGGTIVVAYQADYGDPIGIIAYNFSLTENSDGTLSGNLHETLAYGGFSTDASVILTRE